jgi:chromosome condensin MukBEF ATPase and DNA-binding subunit MukB
MSHSTWQTLYTAALTESDPNKLTGRIEAARSAINRRLEELTSAEDRERQQLDRALHALFTLPGRRRTA